MTDLVHNFGAWKRKRGACFKRVIDATPEVVVEADQHLTGEGSDGQAVTPHPDRVYGMCNRRVAYVHQGLP